MSREQTARVVARTEQSSDAADGAASRRAGAVEQAHSRIAEAPPAGEAASRQASSAGAKPLPRRKLLLIGAGVAAALAVLSYLAYYLVIGRFYISTDDAYVRANNTMLGARVAGHIAAILPADNAFVDAGEVILRIDDGDYKIAADAARTRIATQDETINRIGRQVAANQNLVVQTRAQLASAEAGQKRAELDYDRQHTLNEKGFASHATLEVSEAGRDQSVAAVTAARAAYEAALNTTDVARAQQSEARAQLAELRTALARAERDLAFTVVRAPVAGIFSNRLVNLGDFVVVGQRLGNIVPLDDVFIDANFKETQLRRIRPGQSVSLTVDAYGSRSFEGDVVSISPAAGSVFTLLPPDNATGNFTKIVQRLPVRIHVSKEVARQNLLRAGMSVYVTVDTTSADSATRAGDSERQRHGAGSADPK